MKGVLLLILQCFLAQNLHAELIEAPEIAKNDDENSENDNDTSELFVIEPEEDNSSYSQNEDDVQAEIPEELDIMSVAPENEKGDSPKDAGKGFQVVHVNHSIMPVGSENESGDASKPEEKTPKVIHMDHSILNNFIIQKTEDADVKNPAAADNQATEDDEEEDDQKNIVEYTLEEKKPAPEIKSLENLDQLLNSEVIELTHATIQILDKVSTNCRHEKMNIDEPLKVGDLTIILRRAFMTAPHVIPFSVIGYVEILEKGEKIFGNWMCGTYPSAITFDHAMFDVKVTNEKD